jgi:1-deoxy-D-xylulose-5-phosphate reductoisomerase
MKLPIALGLTWPERLPDVAPPCDWTTATSWTFEPLDSDAFPAVELARSAGLLGGTAPAVFNAANEECVDAFHDDRIGFLDIPSLVERVLSEHAGLRPTQPALSARVGSTLVGNDELSLDAVLAADAWARERTAALVSSMNQQTAVEQGR